MLMISLQIAIYLMLKPLSVNVLLQIQWQLENKCQSPLVLRVTIGMYHQQWLQTQTQSGTYAEPHNTMTYKFLSTP